MKFNADAHNSGKVDTSRPNIFRSQEGDSVRHILPCHRAHMANCDLRTKAFKSGAPPFPHHTLPSCSSTTFANRSDSTNCSRSNAESRTIFASTGSASGSTSASTEPTYRPGVNT